MTDAEKKLWIRIRKKQLKDLQFYIQKIIGNYIADFYCPKADLVVELDGGQHYCVEGIGNDKTRDSYFTSIGLKVLRFSDRDVLMNIDAVLEETWRHL